MQYNFEWDPEKAKTNKNKHKIHFEHAATIFQDQRTISIYDNEHRKNEDRWINMGLLFNGILLIVNHTYKRIDEKTAIVRIISSRKATKQGARACHSCVAVQSREQVVNTQERKQHAGKADN